MGDRRPAPSRDGRQKKLPTSRGPQRASAAVGSAVLRGGVEVCVELKAGGIDARAWASLASHYLRRLGLPKAGLSVLLCGDARSRALNRLWRRRDKPTDVLSFPLNDGKLAKGYSGPLGDLAINLPYARRKGLRFGATRAEELAFLMLHGLLHLKGMHHDNPKDEAAMWRESLRHFPPPPRLLKGLVS